MSPQEILVLRGGAKFVSDRANQGPVVAFVRSPYPRARILGMDLSPAMAMPGVIAVVDSGSLGHPLMPVPNPQILRLPDPLTPLLASGQALYLGQPVAIVVAQSVWAAQDAAEAVMIDYEPLNDDAAAQQAEVASFSFGEAIDEHAQRVPNHTLEFFQAQPRLAAFAMEPRSIWARWDEITETLQCDVGTQAPTRARDHIAQLCGLPKDKVHLRANQIGGAYGSKASLSPEELAVALIAHRMKMGVGWNATRSEEFLSAPQGRSSSLHAQLQVDQTGELLALQANLSFELGGWWPFSAFVPARNAARILPGPYRVGAVQTTAKLHASAKPATSIYRGAGRPEAALIMEALIDKAAWALNMDPLEIRRRNLLPAESMPFHTLTGQLLDSGDYPAMLERAALEFGYQARRHEQAQRRLQGEVVGIGIAMYVEPCGQGSETARVRWLADNEVEVASGTASQGQAHVTLFAGIVAAELGVSPDNVRVLIGDTDVMPEGTGSLASRSTAIGGSAVKQAAQRVKQQRQSGQSLPLEAFANYEVAMEAWSSGCVMLQMVIDRDTGVPGVEAVHWVDDCGTVMDKVGAHGQLVGGMAQGLGQALFEAMVYDTDSQLLTGSLMDYCIPRAADVPHVEISSHPTSTQANLLGAKGLGEAGCIGVPAALYNAAMDAMRPFGIQSDLGFPLRSEQFWRIMNGGHEEQ